MSDLNSMRKTNMRCLDDGVRQFKRANFVIVPVSMCLRVRLWGLKAIEVHREINNKFGIVNNLSWPLTTSFIPLSLALVGVSDP